MASHMDQFRGPPVEYDGVLRLDIPPETKIVGFADDIAIVVVAKNEDQVVQVANETIGVVGQLLFSMDHGRTKNRDSPYHRETKESITITFGDIELTWVDIVGHSNNT